MEDKMIRQAVLMTDQESVMDPNREPELLMLFKTDNTAFDAIGEWETQQSWIDEHEAKINDLTARIEALEAA